MTNLAVDSQDTALIISVILRKLFKPAVGAQANQDLKVHKTSEHEKRQCAESNMPHQSDETTLPVATWKLCVSYKMKKMKYIIHQLMA